MPIGPFLEQSEQAIREMKPGSYSTMPAAARSLDDCQPDAALQ
jgi:hypothetical protein